MRFRKDTLKNGVRLLVSPMSHLDSVAVMIGVGAGSRYEEKRVPGVAHFIEHMMFKGTKKRPTALAISSEIDSIGARFNAFTDKEFTIYYAKAAAKNLPKILDLLTDIIFHSKFDSQEIEREKGVILEELRMYRDTPQRWVAHIYNRLLFGDHPLGWDILGTEQILPAVKREDFITYLDSWYRSENIVVAVAGKIEERRALRETWEILGRLNKKDVQPPLRYKSSQKEPAITLEERKIDQTHFILGLRAYHRGHPNREKLEILATILGGGASSRIFDAIRGKRGLAYYVGAGWEPFSDTGSVLIWAGVNTARSEEAIKAVLEELQKLKEKQVPANELKKVKEMLRGNLFLGIESTDGACSYLLTQEVLEGKIETPEEKLRKVDAVTAEDVRGVAQELFVTKGLNLALIGPFSDPNRFRKLLKLS